MPARKPSKVLELSGAFRKNPQRARPNEPVGEGPLGPPPDRLSDAEKAAWDEIARRAPRGVLTGSDRFVVELAARLKVYLDETPVSEIKPQLMSRYAVLLGQCGFSPSTRAGLAVEDKHTANPFAQL